MLIYSHTQAGNPGTLRSPDSLRRFATLMQQGRDMIESARTLIVVVTYVPFSASLSPSCAKRLADVIKAVVPGHVPADPWYHQRRPPRRLPMSMASPTAPWAAELLSSTSCPFIDVDVARHAVSLAVLWPSQRRPLSQQYALVHAADVVVAVLSSDAPSAVAPSVEAVEQECEKENAAKWLDAIVLAAASSAEYRSGVLARQATVPVVVVGGAKGEPEDSRCVLDCDAAGIRSFLIDHLQTSDSVRRAAINGGDSTGSRPGTDGVAPLRLLSLGACMKSGATIVRVVSGCVSLGDATSFMNAVSHRGIVGALQSFPQGTFLASASAGQTVRLRWKDVDPRLHPTFISRPPPLFSWGGHASPDDAPLPLYMCRISLESGPMATMLLDRVGRSLRRKCSSFIDTSLQLFTPSGGHGASVVDILDDQSLVIVAQRPVADNHGWPTLHGKGRRNSFSVGHGGAALQQRPPEQERPRESGPEADLDAKRRHRMDTLTRCGVSLPNERETVESFCPAIVLAAWHRGGLLQQVTRRIVFHHGAFVEGAWPLQPAGCRAEGAATLPRYHAAPDMCRILAPFWNKLADQVMVPYVADCRANFGCGNTCGGISMIQGDNASSSSTVTSTGRDDVPRGGPTTQRDDVGDVARDLVESGLCHELLSDVSTLPLQLPMTGGIFAVIDSTLPISVVGLLNRFSCWAADEASPPADWDRWLAFSWRLLERLITAATYRHSAVFTSSYFATPAQYVSSAERGRIDDGAALLGGLIRALATSPERLRRLWRLENDRDVRGAASPRPDAEVSLSRRLLSLLHARRVAGFVEYAHNPEGPHRDVNEASRAVCVLNALEAYRLGIPYTAPIHDALFRAAVFHTGFFNPTRSGSSPRADHQVATAFHAHFFNPPVSGSPLPQVDAFTMWLRSQLSDVLKKWACPVSNPISSPTSHSYVSWPRPILPPGSSVVVRILYLVTTVQRGQLTRCHPSSQILPHRLITLCRSWPLLASILSYVG